VSHYFGSWCHHFFSSAN